jgi:hypothetical protein
VYGKRKEAEEKKSIEETLASDSDQKVIFAKMGMPVEVEFLGEGIEIKSVSPHVLTLIQKLVIDHKKAQIKFNIEKSTIRKKLLSDSLGEKKEEMQEILS